MNERIVMIGAGYWAQFQVEGWRDAGVPLAAIALALQARGRGVVAVTATSCTVREASGRAQRSPPRSVISIVTS